MARPDLSSDVRWYTGQDKKAEGGLLVPSTLDILFMSTSEGTQVFHFSLITTPSTFTMSSNFPFSMTGPTIFRCTTSPR
jgi:hypothetical protein